MNAILLLLFLHLNIRQGVGNGSGEYPRKADHNLAIMPRQSGIGIEKGNRQGNHLQLTDPQQQGPRHVQMEDSRSSSGKRYTVQSKRWIVRLLAVCSILALILYFTWQPDPTSRLQSASLLDDLIRDTLENYPVPVHRIRTQTIAIDSLNSRRIYTIAVPPEFSKTEWHYELDRVVRPYRVETPGRVHFPQRDLHIHLYYNQNIVRTVRLQTRSEDDL